MEEEGGLGREKLNKVVVSGLAWLEYQNNQKAHNGAMVANSGIHRIRILEIRC